MKTKALLIAVMITFISSFTLERQDELTAKQIVQKVKDKPNGDNRKTIMKMDLINKRGKKRTRTIMTYSIDIGEDSKTIMVFISPADVKGTGFLIWDYDNPDKEDDRWLYLPAMKRTRRISGKSAKEDYFMGSDFTYDDMSDRNINEDTYKLLAEESVNGVDCWKIESKPIDKKEMYSKKISWIQKEKLMVSKVIYYDRQGNLLKTLTISDFKKIDGIWTAHKMHLVNNQNKHQTVLSFSGIEYNTEMDENMFTVSNLEKGIF